MILHNPPEPRTARNSVQLVLVTDHYDEEIERLTGLGAMPLKEIKLPAGRNHPVIRQTTCADPEGNEFELVIWQSK